MFKRVDAGGRSYLFLQRRYTPLSQRTGLNLNEVYTVSHWFNVICCFLLIITEHNVRLSYHHQYLFVCSVSWWKKKKHFLSYGSSWLQSKVCLLDQNFVPEQKHTFLKLELWIPSNISGDFQSLDSKGFHPVSVPCQHVITWQSIIHCCDNGKEVNIQNSMCSWFSGHNIYTSLFCSCGSELCLQPVSLIPFNYLLHLSVIQSLACSFTYYTLYVLALQQRPSTGGPQPESSPPNHPASNCIWKWIS